MEDFRLEDSKSEIYPQSGTDRDIIDADTETAATDEAAAVDTCSVVRIVAGRPQPNSPYSSAQSPDRTFLFSAKKRYNEIAKEELQYER